jgi:hypothetical protein
MSNVAEICKIAERKEHLRAAFLRLSEENQTYMLGQAEGLKVAQDMLKPPSLHETLCVCTVAQARVG